MSSRLLKESPANSARPARTYPFTALCLTLVTGAAMAQQPVAVTPPTSSGDASGSPESPIVPVHDEPHHRQIFQYGPMRILDLQIPPGDISWFHTHEWPVLYMTLNRSAARIQNLGSDWSGGGGRSASASPRTPPAPQPRATSTTSYAQQPVTHRLENVGDDLFRAMVVVNETQGDDTASVQAAGFDGMPELTNPWFRSYRLTLAAGETTRGHMHHAPVVIFQATDGNGIAEGPMPFELNEPGQWAFFDAETEHEIRNVGDGAIELLEIEVRRK